MVEVIQHGDPDRLKRTKRFVCTECGCIFKCDKEDYKISSQYNETRYYASCPDCKHSAYEETEIHDHPGY
jgi:hypothetical protein